MFVTVSSIIRLSLGGILLFTGVDNVVAADKYRSPAVVELFTSQGCFSCPPAEAYLGELSMRSDLIALEFHVDYWDNLVYGSDGKWKDPFSSPEFTNRQRQYNLSVRQKSGVYTPQMIIGGAIETVGSHKNRVEKAIKHVNETRISPLSVRVMGGDSSALKIQIHGKSPDAASVWMVRFLRSVKTKVRAGENRGKSLTSHHIVTGVKRIGEWRGSSLSLTVNGPVTSSEEGCAIIVQKAPVGLILGAGYCPGINF